MPAVVELINGYKRLFLDTQPTDGDDVDYKVIVVVFTDLSADRAQGVFDDVLEKIAGPSYAEEGNTGRSTKTMTGLRSTTQASEHLDRPCRSVVRYAVITDWKFFLDDEDWLNRWAHRYGDSGAQALAEELRPLPWRVGRN